MPGPATDPMLGRDNTLYALAVTVDPDFRGHGVGRALKRRLLERAAELTRDDGTPRYRHATGRNRIPDASAMAHLNDSLGAYTVLEIPEAYDGEGTARYYRQPLGPFVVDAVGEPERGGPEVDLASGIARPFAEPPASLRALAAGGLLYGPAVTKITVLNYLTPAIVRATEYVAALTPELPHAYMCSSRDETLDKSVRALRWHRPEGNRVIGFEGGYVGHTTAAARSVSDPTTHRQGAPYFDWPRVPHPADGVEVSVKALRDAIGDDPSKTLGLYLEPVQERTGRTIPDDFWPALEALRAETGVPVVFAETASAYFRSGLGAFAYRGLSLTPDLMIWWTGGHLGFVHTTTAYRIAKPFTLVSTWDGDELSLIQAHHQLRAARHVDVAAASAALDHALSGVESSGLGAYRVITAGADADALEAKGVRVKRFANGHLGVAPALDRAVDDANALRAAL